MQFSLRNFVVDEFHNFHDFFVPTQFESMHTYAQTQHVNPPQLLSATQFRFCMLCFIVSSSDAKQTACCWVFELFVARHYFVRMDRAARCALADACVIPLSIVLTTNVKGALQCVQHIIYQKHKREYTHPH
jgi:hypothetical protein